MGPVARDTTIKPEATQAGKVPGGGNSAEYQREMQNNARRMGR
jgi:hypothetical protein